MTVDQLNLIDGYFEGKRFIMRGILGYAVSGVFNAEGLLSLVRLIHDDELVNFIMDDGISIPVPVELNVNLKKELIMIAEALDN